MGGRGSGLGAPVSAVVPGVGAAWAEVVAARWGLHFPPARHATLLDRLGQRLRTLGLGDLTAYRGYLARHPQEWQRLADALIVAESRFYREADTARALAEQILPELLGHREVGGSGRRELALWSAGCSTGEEAYTLAMIALEAVPLAANWELRILGSDLGTSTIASARGDLRRAPPGESPRRMAGALHRAAAAARRRGDARIGAPGTTFADDLSPAQSLRRGLADRRAGCDRLPERAFLLPPRGADARPQSPLRYPAPRRHADRGRDRAADEPIPSRHRATSSRRHLCL